MKTTLTILFIQLSLTAFSQTITIGSKEWLNDRGIIQGQTLTKHPEIHFTTPANPNESIHGAREFPTMPIIGDLPGHNFVNPISGNEKQVIKIKNYYLLYISMPYGVTINDSIVLYKPMKTGACAYITHERPDSLVIVDSLAFIYHLATHPDSRKFVELIKK